MRQEKGKILLSQILKNHLHVPLHVKTQMITPTERSLTKLATKGFITSMLSAIMETVNTISKSTDAQG